MLSFSEHGLPPYLAPFFFLSYSADAPKTPDSFHDSAYYTTGAQDVCLLITCIAAMAIMRDALRLGVFEPFARWKLARDQARRPKRINGTGKAHGRSLDQNIVPKRKLRHMHKSIVRFGEQGWPACYYPLQWAFGLYVNYSLPTRIFDPTSLWLGYPHIPLAAPLKLYYITQTAFYTHQVFVLHAEARRKDHVEMIAHHIVTLALMSASYVFNFTRAGCIIMVLMDTCDILLPIAKMCRYMVVRQSVCDALFTFYLVSWFVSRHILFTVVIISTYCDLPRVVPFEWAPHRGRFLSKSAWVAGCTSLTILQVLQLMWFVTICRVARRVVTTGEGASDIRSDDEGAWADEKEE
ncbi:TLC domain-containing protein [Mycena vulgaris]|nr:TLC domain-containing protein [Mycena vulgaris]